MTQHIQTSALCAEHLPPAIVIRGLPGIGKTTLANEVVRQLENAGVKTFHINADNVRESVSKGLGFTQEDRVENARRIGSLVRLAQANGYVPVVDFVMPTKQTFDAFWYGVSSSKFVLFSLRPSADFQSRFPDTVKIYERIQPWWAGAVLREAQISNEIDSYSEDSTPSVAEWVIQTYTNRTTKF
jgi:adenylylsulfate kinase-like enzyme